MPSKPTPAEQTIPTAAANYLVAAVVGAVILTGSIVVDLRTTLDVPRGVSALLAAMTAIGGYGYLIRSGQSAIIARIAELERKLDERSTSTIDEESAGAARRINLRLLTNPN